MQLVKQRPNCKAMRQRAIKLWTLSSRWSCWLCWEQNGNKTEEVLNLKENLYVLARRFFTIYRKFVVVLSIENNLRQFTWSLTRKMTHLVLLKQRGWRASMSTVLFRFYLVRNVVFITGFGLATYANSFTLGWRKLECLLLV